MHVNERRYIVVHSGLQILSCRASMPLHNYFYVQVYPRNKTDVDIRIRLYNFLFIRDTPVLDSLAIAFEPSTFRSLDPLPLPNIYATVFYLWYILARLHFSAEELLLYPRRRRPCRRRRPRRRPQNVRANVKVLEFQSLCIFSCKFKFAYHINKAPFN